MWQIRCSSPAIRRRWCAAARRPLYANFFPRCWCAHPESVDNIYMWYTFRDILFECLHPGVEVILRVLLVHTSYTPEIMVAVYCNGNQRLALHYLWAQNVFFIQQPSGDLAAGDLKWALWTPCNYLPIIAHMFCYNWASTQRITDSEWLTSNDITYCAEKNPKVIR